MRCIFIDKVKININDIKFEDITVTFQSRKPRIPIIKVTAYKQLAIGRITHRNSLKIMINVIIVLASIKNNLLDALHLIVRLLRKNMDH